MSIKIMTRVWDSAPFDGYTLLALLALADAASDDGVCWPSLKSLMVKTRQPKRTVYQAIKNLCAAGWLERCEITGSAGAKLKAYRIVPAADASAYPAQPSAQPALPSAQPAQSSAYPAQPPHPLIGGTVREPSLEPSAQPPLRVVSIETRSARLPESFRLPEWVDRQAWSEYEGMRRRIKAPLTDGARDRNVRELAKLRDEGHAPTAVLLQSVDKCWKGLFALKTGPTASAAAPQRRYREEDYATA